MTREITISTRTAIDDLMSEEKILKEERPTYGVRFAEWEIFGEGAGLVVSARGQDGNVLGALEERECSALGTEREMEVIS